MFCRNVKVFKIPLVLRGSNYKWLNVLIFLCTLLLCNSYKEATLAQESRADIGWPVITEIWAAWELQSSLYGAGGYEYSLYVEIGNPNPFPILFDEIVMRFENSMAGPSGWVREARITFMATEIVTRFSYGGEEQNRQTSVDDGSPEELSIDGYRGVALPHPLSSGPVYPTLPGSEPTTLTVILLRSGEEVTVPQICVLPPVLRIPDRYSLAPEDRGLHIILRPLPLLPSNSGITNDKLVTRIFDKARSISQDAVLVDVQPRFVTEHRFEDGRIQYTLHAWEYTFCSEKGTFVVYKDDPGCFEWRSKDSSELSTLAFDSDLFKTARIDCNVAVLIADIAGARIDGRLNLRLIEVGQKARLAWVQHHQMGYQQLAVLVDTGEVLVWNQPTSTFEPAKHCIWNE